VCGTSVSVVVRVVTERNKISCEEEKTDHATYPMVKEKTIAEFLPEAAANKTLRGL
jgi:hypothetical protein